MRLLLIEDDPMIGESMEEALRSESYAVDWVRDGSDGQLAINHTSYDLVLLDLGLPNRSGMDLLKRYRSQGGIAPVMIVTARDATSDRVQGLDAGADDYLIKPFSLEELQARIRAVLRRRGSHMQSSVQYGPLSVDLASHRVQLHGTPLQLSAREFAVLRALLDQPGAVVSKSELEDKIYGWNEKVESNAIDVFIYHLRKKLGSALIKNVRGVGYRLCAS
jgi:two-component system OmpR family response regulator/two-component system response regulator QseB